MSKRGRWAAAAAAIAIVATAVPAGGVQPAETTVLASGRLATVDGRTSIVHPLAPLFERGRDPLAALAAATTLMAQGPAPTAAQPVAGDGQDAAVADTDEDIIGTRAGDLDGDGMADVLALTSDHGWTTAVAAVDGESGAVLWSQATGDVYAYPAGADLTGDGSDDVVRLTLTDVLEEESADECSGSACVSHYSMTYREGIAVLEGATGDVVWERTWDGSYRERFTRTEGTTDDRVDYEISRDAVVAITGPDVTGDQLRDVVFNRVVSLTTGTQTDTRAIAVDKTDGARTLRSATEASIAAGNTGDTVLRRESSTGPSVSYLVPAGDTVGDGRGDLAWERSVAPDRSSSCVRTITQHRHCTDEPEATSYAVEMIDGSTLQPAWSTSVPVPTGGLVIVAAVHDDLSGDGKDDVLQYVGRPHSETRSGGNPLLGGSYSWGSLWYEYDASLLNGATGAALWARDDGAIPMAYTLSDGQPEVLLGDVDEDDTAAVVRFERVRGATGETIAAHSREFALTPQPSEASQHIWSYVDVFTPGDVDGDGRYDLGALVHEEHDDASQPGSSQRTDLGGVLAVDAGLDGAGIYLQEFDDDRSFTVLGDLDGDGRDDLLQTVEDSDGPVVRSTVTALRPVDAEVLWSRSAQGVWVWVRNGADQDGAPGMELLEHRTPRSGNGGTTLRSLSGRTGTERWSLGS